MRRVCFALVVLMVVVGSAAAEQRLFELKMTDGSTIVGYVEAETPERVVLRTLGGAVIEVARANVISLIEAKGRVVNGQYFREDSNPTRLFFAPTGRSIKKGEGYVGVYEIFLSFVQVGITDRLSIGAGTPLLFGFDGDRPFWVTPKVQVYEGRTASAAVGVLHFLNIEGVNLGIAYAAGTFGTRDDALTVGLGWAYANNNDNNEGSVVVMVGGERRLSRRVKFITENYAFTGGGIASAGFRFLGESFSADIGLFAPLGVGDLLIALPIVNFVWKF